MANLHFRYRSWIVAKNAFFWYVLCFIILKIAYFIAFLPPLRLPVISSDGLSVTSHYIHTLISRGEMHTRVGVSMVLPRLVRWRQWKASVCSSWHWCPSSGIWGLKLARLFNCYEGSASAHATMSKSFSAVAVKAPMFFGHLHATGGVGDGAASGLSKGSTAT